MYEVWYLTWNHAATDTGYWLRHVTEVPMANLPAGKAGGHGQARAEMWFARFDARRPERTFGFHRRFPLTALHAKASPFELAIGECRLRHDSAQGALEGDGHKIRWNLKWEPSRSVLRHLPDVMYRRGGLGETTVQSPNPRVAMAGTLEIDGEELSFVGTPMGQTHLWGKKHAYSWAWGRCAEWQGGENAVLETLSVKLERRGLKLPTMSLSTLVLGDETIRSVGWVHGLRNEASWKPGSYKFTASQGDVLVKAEMSGRLDRFVVAPYVDPDGQEVYCANTEIGDARVEVWRKVNGHFRQAEVLEAPRRAHFETGGRERPAGVERMHKTIEIGEK